MVSREVGLFFELRDLSSECVIVVPDLSPRSAINNKNNMETRLAFFH